MAFVNYHKHSMWTNARQTDSSTFVEEYVDRIKQLKQNVISTVEHGWQGNVINYYELAKANNLKLLIGAEAYWVKDRKEKDSTNCHICLLAKNEKGRRALNKALTIANIDGFYYKPRMDEEIILSLPKDDIWCTSACLAFYKYGFDYSKDFVLKLHKHFGNNFYLELQTHNVDTQKEINKNILNWSKEYKINYICGLDSHYIYPEDSVKRNIYIESRGIRYPEEEQFILDFPDEKTIFDRFMLQGVLSEEEAINAIKNTYIFEDVEEYTGECFTKEIKMPVALKYKAMTTEQKENELKRIVYNEFDKYSKNFDIEKKKQYTDEIERNLSVIHEINHADYFLGNYEFIKRGKELGCMLSPTGRGSSVSFLVNFFLGFTKVDKMQSAIPLYAERFLSAKRVLEAKSLADIDHNSGYPDKLQLAMEEVYGKGHCYPLIAYGTMKDKGAWKMYARVNNIDFDIANSVSEQIDQYELDLKHASEDEKENIKIQDYISPEYYPIYEKSRGYLKLVNSLSVHPCANLLYSEDIIEEFGLILVKSDTNKKETLCVCADGAWIENYKFLKADLLKVDVSKLIYSLYNRIGGDVISIQDLLTLSEKHNAWDIYSRGITMGINQVEQEGSRQKVMRYKPRNIAELAAFVAAVRPGFKSLYKRFEERNRMSYGVESIDKLLESSNGMILYQENVMAILNYAGYDMSDCYTILKAIAKKKPEVLQKRKIEFHDMMINKLVNTEKIDNEKAEEITANIWQVIDDCSSYSFNSSHAMCVSLDGLYCALIKKVYPLIFYETYLNLLEENQDKDKIILAKEEASKYFNILFPKPKFGDDNRKSVADMNNNSIITSLKSIKGFSTTTANELYKLGQYFKDKKSNFYNVLIEIENKKLKINTAHIEKLISIGYFSKYGSISCLTKFYICYQKIHGRKEFKISNEDKIPIKIEILKNFCGTETSKTLKNFNEIGFFEFLLNKLNSLKDDIKDVIFYENEYLGQIYTKDENAPDNLYYVEEVIFKKTIRSVLYHVKDGTHKTVKIRKKVFDEEPFTGNKMIKVYEIKQEPRYIYQGEDENGKPKFIKDYENMEDILKDYYIIE